MLLLTLSNTASRPIFYKWIIHKGTVYLICNLYLKQKVGHASTYLEFKSLT